MNFDPIQMQGMIRYANRVRIKDEDLAQHSFGVAYYCFQICHQYGLPEDIMYKAVSMGVIHDIGECFTSDLPHDVKYENPELKTLCDQLERRYIFFIPEIKDLWCELEDNKDSIYYWIVKLADTKSVISYVKREIDLGNRTDEMKEIEKESMKRYEEYKKILDQKVGEYYEK